MTSLRRALIVPVLAAAMAAPAPVLADPPPWAPAHGYRAKHEGKHKHKKGKAPKFYELPVGIPGGSCDTGVLISQIAGGALGGLAGSQIGSGSGQKAAIIGGVLIGTLLGGEIGRSMGLVDEACLSQTLEHATPGQSIVWSNPDTNYGYQVVPQAVVQQNGQYCREYQTVVTIGGKTERAYGTACRQPDGSWQPVRG